MWWIQLFISKGLICIQKPFNSLIQYIVNNIIQYFLVRTGYIWSPWKTAKSIWKNSLYLSNKIGGDVKKKKKKMIENKPLNNKCI